MIRKIITIDQTRCNGCGDCVTACHEGAIGLRDGKAVLLRDDYCDGLGDCLPTCPAGAISFTEREAAAYDEAAVLAAARAEQGGGTGPKTSGITPAMAAFGRSPNPAPAPALGAMPPLGHWPIQLRLVPSQADFFANADLLVAADCCAYAYAAFHQECGQGRVTVIGCPKLDGVNYTDILTEILRSNPVRSVSLARMSLPCCGGIERSVRDAIAASGKDLACEVSIISPQGKRVGFSGTGDGKPGHL